ncbi:ABC transporter permease [Chloroflexota bacterium]
MKNTATIALKEFRSYLASPMAYVVTGIFLILTGFLFSSTSTTFLETSIKGLWGFWGAFLMLILAVLLTMRLLAEERKMGTLELLMTAPVRDSEIILGKFFASLGVLTIMLVLTFYYPLLLMWFGDPDWGPIFAGYLGLLLLGSTALSIGIFASSLTANQLVAAVVAGGIVCALWFSGVATTVLPPAMSNVLNYISLYYHFPDFMTGVVDTRAIVYYLSTTALFLFLATRSLENSRWN